MHVPSIRSESSEASDHAVGREKWKAMMSELGEDSGLAEDLGSLGNMSKGREGGDGDETG